MFLRLIVIAYLRPLFFFLYCENELLLLILVDDNVFYSAGVAMVRALLISLLGMVFFRFVEKVVFCRSMSAFK